MFIASLATDPDGSSFTTVGVINNFALARELNTLVCHKMHSPLCGHGDTFAHLDHVRPRNHKWADV